MIEEEIRLKLEELNKEEEQLYPIQFVNEALYQELKEGIESKRTAYLNELKTRHI